MAAWRVDKMGNGRRFGTGQRSTFIYTYYVRCDRQRGGPDYPERQSMVIWNGGEVLPKRPTARQENNWRCKSKPLVLVRTSRQGVVEYLRENTNDFISNQEYQETVSSGLCQLKFRKWLDLQLVGSKRGASCHTITGRSLILKELRWVIPKASMRSLFVM